MPTTRIEPNYKVTIPKEARDSLGLEVGEEVETITHKDSITFRRVKTVRSYTPTKRELAAIEKGRAEIRRGEYYTLDELRASLARHHRKASAKASRSHGKA
jgi:AbrB family looped-hinge helix DNA binding protein